MGWREGPFIGNGMLGMIVYVDPQQPNGLRFEIGRSDVYDRREAGRGTICGTAGCRSAHFQLIPVGTIKDGSARLDLWNAEITGEIVTDRGSIRWKAFAAEDRVMVVEVESSPGEEGCRFVVECGTGDQSLVYGELVMGAQTTGPRASLPRNINIIPSRPQSSWRT